MFRHPSLQASWPKLVMIWTLRIFHLLTSKVVSPKLWDNSQDLFSLCQWFMPLASSGFQNTLKKWWGRVSAQVNQLPVHSSPGPPPHKSPTDLESSWLNHHGFYRYPQIPSFLSFLFWFYPEILQDSLRSKRGTNLKSLLIDPIVTFLLLWMTLKLWKGTFKDWH